MASTRRLAAARDGQSAGGRGPPTNDQVKKGGVTRAGHGRRARSSPARVAPCSLCQGRLAAAAPVRHPAGTPVAADPPGRKSTPGGSKHGDSRATPTGRPVPLFYNADQPTAL